MLNTMTLAQAVGEAPMDDLVFIPGEDFDPYDEDDVAAVSLAMDIDMHDRARAELRSLQLENARLRALLGEDDDEVYDPRWDNRDV